MIHVNITVTGKVQKIGFRFMSMQTAVKLGVSGFVKNVDNDKVYIEAEGIESSVEEFIKWCKTGPTWAKVNQISIEKGELKNFTSFDIQHR
jgi:acylphosphatase